jgi:hypothetical protein
VLVVSRVVVEVSPVVEVVEVSVLELLVVVSPVVVVVVSEVEVVVVSVVASVAVTGPVEVLVVSSPVVGGEVSVVVGPVPLSESETPVPGSPVTLVVGTCPEVLVEEVSVPVALPLSVVVEVASPQAASRTRTRAGESRIDIEMRRYCQSAGRGSSGHLPFVTRRPPARRCASSSAGEIAEARGAE